jgi:predicted DNA-binding antitoxin AbrB/MazE fold protein
MQVEATYDNGHLRFNQPIKFKHQPVKVTVNVPDEEVSNPIETKTTDEMTKKLEEAADKSPLLNDIRKILGTYFKPRPSASVAEDKEVYMHALLEKYGK